MSRVVSVLAKTLSIMAVAGTVAATVATFRAYQYRSRTGEGFVFAYVLAGWVLVALVALAGGALLLSIRRSRR